MALTPRTVRMDPSGSKAAALEDKLRREAAQRGLSGEAANAYIYGTLNKAGLMRGNKTTRKGAGKAKRKDNFIPTYAPVKIDPALQRGDACWKGYVQVGTKRKGNREVPNCVPAASGVAKPKAQKDTEDGKKFVKTVTNPETGRKNKVRYGAKGYRIAPGTDKGDRYCARSFGDMKSEGYNCSGAERNTPLCLSRAKWKCSGKTSRRDEGLTPGKS